MNVITAEGLVKVYQSRKTEVRALDGVDLEVPEGTVLGLLGPNGAGKTTTVRILATLLKPDAGHATVAGFDVVKQAQQLRSVIGLSGQYAAVDENLTGRENLRMFGRLYQLPQRRGARARATSCWSSSTWSRPADRVVKTYSGGMRRRLDLGQRPHRPAAAAVPRRADDRPRPAQPPRHVGRHPGPRPRGHDAAADHPVPRGGRRAGRHHRRRRPRPDHRPRAPPTSSRPRSAVSASRSWSHRGRHRARRRGPRPRRRRREAIVDEHTRQLTVPGARAAPSALVAGRARPRRGGHRHRRHRPAPADARRRVPRPSPGHAAEERTRRRRRRGSRPTGTGRAA